MEEILKFVEYREGKLYWVQKPASQIQVGSEVGSVNNKGYLQFNLKGKSYKNHRVIFFIHNGYLPKFVDHRDRDRLNNFPDNLRDATRGQNSANRRSSGSSQYLGVNWVNNGAKNWQSRITAGGVNHYLGSFLTEREAAVAYDNAALRLHGEFANVNFPSVA